MQEFIAHAQSSKEILNSANLLQTLAVNALICGASGTGKKTLASHILQQNRIYDAKQLQQDIADNALSLNTQEIIVDKIENITNIELFLNWANSNEIRVIATTLKEDLNNQLKDFFSITLFIPNLDQRKEDIKPLANKFSKEAMQVLGANKKPEKLIINTNENAISLRKSIYFSYLFETIGENEIMMLLEKFMYENMQGENAYRDLVYLFEAPLLKASQKKYKSQLQMSKHLGLNRITLRKKIELHKELL
jgi:transcriptional regulator with PAS, ATPase and Fis domain